MMVIEPARVANYLRWWERRPSRWLAFLRDDHDEADLEDLPGAYDFEADGEAHASAVETRLLVSDPRPDSAAWQITGRGLCFVHEHYRAPDYQHEELSQRRIPEWERARDMFFAVDTDESRRIDWTIWHAAELGSKIVVATLAHVFEASVVELPRPTEPETEVMVVEIAGRRSTLRMAKSGSAGYFERNPEEWEPGADRDVDLDGLSARLVEFLDRAPEQLGLFGRSP